MPERSSDSAGQSRWRKTQAVLRGVVVTAAIVTGLAAIFFWPATTILAIVLLALYLVLVHFNVFYGRFAQRRPADETKPTAEAPSTSAAAAAGGKRAESDAQSARAAWSAGLKTAFGIGGSLAVVAIILAAVLLNWRIVVIGAVIVFCYLVLFGGPYWLAAIEEEWDMARERVTGEERTIH